VDGEEGGLTGAREFVRVPPVPQDRIVMNVNLDMVGRNERGELYAAGTSHSPFLRPYLDSLARRPNSIKLLLGHDDPNGPRRDDWTTQSDHAAFHRAGIPFIYFGVEDHPDYHRPTDVVERLMPEFFAGAANTVLAALRAFDSNLGAIAAARAAPPARLMSFNIRYGTANDGDHRWPNRQPHVLSTIRDFAPHLLGLQEALRFQLDEIGRAFPHLREIGVGRDDGVTRGEYSALLVDTARFSVAETGHFWYSDTPTVPGSRHWGNNVTRICTWARLVDRITGDSILAYNTHWDHESQPSRVKSAAMLLDHIATTQRARELVLLFADFNSGESNPAFQALISSDRVPLHDTFRAVHPTATVVGTFNSFRGDSTGEKIDAILASRSWEVRDAGIDRTRFGPLWASDHFAVTAVVRAPKRD
jgi:endonuclease/exonuclease/phosphatase family metal-dependent hydrolase